MKSTLNNVKLKTVSLMFVVNRFLGLVKWQPEIGQTFYRSNSTIFYYSFIKIIDTLLKNN